MEVFQGSLNTSFIYFFQIHLSYFTILLHLMQAFHTVLPIAFKLTFHHGIQYPRIYCEPYYYEILQPEPR